MSWTNLEAEKIVKYLKEAHVHDSFPAIEKECTSYFDTYDMERDSLIEEFGFMNIPELQELLKRKCVVNSSVVDTACAIAAFKNKPEIQEEEKTAEEGYFLPTFIYNF